MGYRHPLDHGTDQVNFAAISTVGVASGFSASDVIRVPNAEHFAIGVNWVNGSAYAFQIQGAIAGLARAVTSAGPWASITRANGSLMLFTVGAGIVALTPEAAPLAAIRLLCTQSFQLAPQVVTVFAKG